jgi:hypothetical protein
MAGPLGIGDRVDYHGSKVWDHGEWKIHGVCVCPGHPDERRFTLWREWFPERRLGCVRASSLTRVRRRT